MANTTQKYKFPLIALSGGIASGKSTAAQLLRQRGIRVVDADEIARIVVVRGSPGLKAVTEEFGNRFILPDGDLNRAALAELIFSDRDAKRRLEKILHPLIKAQFLRTIESLDLNDTSPVIYEIPLFFETIAQHPEIDKSLLIWAPESLCLERLMTRGKLSREQALARIANQLPLDQKVSLADWVIRNDQDISSLAQQLDQVLVDLS